MSFTEQQLLVGAAVLVAALLVRAVVRNRLVRSKLRLTIFTAAAYLLLLAASLGPTSVARLVVQLGPAIDLLVVLAVINLFVVLAINPWRVDRIPERFPNIVQDAVVIGIFALIGTLVMHEQLWTVSAVGGFVVGFALQDTLGNLFAGLAIQVEKPFRVGHWVSVGQFEGQVAEITWRATKLRTKAGTLVVVPNNIVSKEAITNYSEPEAPTRIQVEVGACYDHAPNVVKAAILEALADVEGVLKEPEPSVVLAEFADSAVSYRVRFWIENYAIDEVIRDRVRVAIYYTFKRRNIEIPYPRQVEYQRVEPQPGRTTGRHEELVRLLGGADIFAPLSAEERGSLVAESEEKVYGAGQTIVTQGDPGESMFVVCSGEVCVRLAASGAEVARIPAGGFFGEMSLLTGEPRTASVSAIRDTVALEITAGTFRALATSRPDVLERVAAAVETRRVGLEATRQAAAALAPAGDAPPSLLARIQKFLRMSVR